MRIPRRSYGGALVIAVVLAAAVARSAPGQPPREAPLTDEEAHAFYREAAEREAAGRLGALERFRYSEWSQQDDFHAHEASFLREYGRLHHLPVRGLMAALERGMRERWPTRDGVDPEERIIPCRPRLAY